MDIVLDPKLVPVLGAVIGAIAGLASGALVSFLSQRSNITSKLVDQYMQIRKEVCEALSDLASLRLAAPIDDEAVEAARSRVSRIYFQYYDFLPRDVLIALNCLYLCLSDSRHRLFGFSDGVIIPLTNRDEIAKLVTRVAIVDNFRYSLPVYLNGPDVRARMAAAINCQARAVLVSMNDCFTLRELMDWSRHMKKPRLTGDRRTRRRPTQK